MEQGDCDFTFYKRKLHSSRTFNIKEGQDPSMEVDAVKTPKEQEDAYVSRPKMPTSPQRQERQTIYARSSLDQSADKICHGLSQSLTKNSFG
jgi:hypothetical protein